MEGRNCEGLTFGEWCAAAGLVKGPWIAFHKARGAWERGEDPTEHYASATKRLSDKVVATEEQNMDETQKQWKTKVEAAFCTVPDFFKNYVPFNIPAYGLLNSPANMTPIYTFVHGYAHTRNLTQHLEESCPACGWPMTLEKNDVRVYWRCTQHPACSSVVFLNGVQEELLRHACSRVGVNTSHVVESFVHYLSERVPNMDTPIRELASQYYNIPIDQVDRDQVAAVWDVLSLRVYGTPVDKLRDLLDQRIRKRTTDTLPNLLQPQGVDLVEQERESASMKYVRFNLRAGTESDSPLHFTPLHAHVLGCVHYKASIIAEADLEPTCPQCDWPMTLDLSLKGTHVDWRCTQFPRCMHASPLTTAQQHYIVPALKESPTEMERSFLTFIEGRNIWNQSPFIVGAADYYELDHAVLTQSQAHAVKRALVGRIHGVPVKSLMETLEVTRDDHKRPEMRKALLVGQVVQADRRRRTAVKIFMGKFMEKNKNTKEIKTMNAKTGNEKKMTPPVDQAKLIGGAMVDGLTMALTDQFGDLLISMARKLAGEKVNVVDDVLATPAGRDCVKLVMATFLHTFVESTGGRIPGSSGLAIGARAQVAYSTAKLASFGMTTFAEEFSQLMTLGQNFEKLSAPRAKLQESAAEKEEWHDHSVHESAGAREAT